MNTTTTVIKQTIAAAATLAAGLQASAFAASTSHALTIVDTKAATSTTSLAAPDRIPPIPPPVGTVYMPNFTAYPGEVALEIGGIENGARGKTYVTAVNGGAHFPDALISSSTTIGPDERFQIERSIFGKVRFKSADGYYVAAVNGGAQPIQNAAYSMTTNEITPDNDALFTPTAPWDIAASYGYTLQTYDNNYLIATNGGNTATGAFFTSYNPDGNTSYTFQHCGDLGTGFAYNINVLMLPYTAEAYTPLYAAYGGGLNGNAVNGHEQPPVLTVYAPQDLRNTDLHTAANFRFIRQTDGTYALQTADGVHYVTAANGGGIEYGFTLHTDATQVQAWEKFRIVDQGNCTYTIQAADGYFLAANTGDISTEFSAPPGGILTVAYGFSPFFVITPVL